MKCATCGVNEPKPIRSSTVYGSFENFRIVMNGPPMASGCTMTFTREPSGRRASTIGLRFVDAPADLAHDLVDDAADVHLVDEAHGRLLDAALALDVDAVRTVHHDFGDVRSSRSSWSIGP